MKTSKYHSQMISRRSVLASTGAVLATPALLRSAFDQDKKIIRISTPANDAEWQAKGLNQFKAEVEENSPTLSVEVHLNATLSIRAPRFQPCSAAIWKWA